MELRNLVTKGLLAVVLLAGFASPNGAPAGKPDPRDTSRPRVEALPPSRGGQDLIGRPMPPLTFDRWLRTPDNRPLETSGKVTLYRWWTNGCPHCERTLPAVEALRKEFEPKGLRVVAVYHPKPPRKV